MEMERKEILVILLLTLTSIMWTEILQAWGTDRKLNQAFDLKLSSRFAL